MDPYSTKRQRIAPPSPTSSPVQTPSLAALSHDHDHSREITLTQLPVSKESAEHIPSLSQPPSFTRRHSKDTLFHKDTHHRHLPKQQQIQQQQHEQEQNQKGEWSPLRQAHEEFHQQRLQHLAKQRQLKRQKHIEQQKHQLQMQQLQIQLQQQQLQRQQQKQQDPQQDQPGPSRSETASPQLTPPPSSYSPVEPQPPQLQTPLSSPQSSRPPTPPNEVHPHFHYHFFTHGQHGLRFQQLGNLHNRPTPLHLQPHQHQRRHSPHPAAGTFLRLAPPPLSGAPGGTGNMPAISPFSPYFGRRTQQFSDWLAVKERERARVENNLTRLREASPYHHHHHHHPHPSGPPHSTHEAKDNLKRLQQKIQQRRARARATLLYDLHQGVKSVEAQVQKQVEMVLSRLKETPGSRYAFALTNTFLNTLPSALSQTILPSALSAVAATAATKATNMTALRDYGEHDDEEEDDDDDDADDGKDDDDDEEKMWFLWQLQQQQVHQDLCYSRFGGHHQPHWPLQQQSCSQHLQSQSAEHLSHELSTIVIAPASLASSSDQDSAPPSPGPLDMAHEACPPAHSSFKANNAASNATATLAYPSLSTSPPRPNAPANSGDGPSPGPGPSSSSGPPTKTVHISREDASVLLSAGSSTTYASAASAVLSAAASAGRATIDSTLPSLIPSVVAPIVCVFSYPTPHTSKAASPQDPYPLFADGKADSAATISTATQQQQQQQQQQQPRKENLYEALVRDYSGPYSVAMESSMSAAAAAAAASAASSSSCSSSSLPAPVGFHGQMDPQSAVETRTMATAAEKSQEMRLPLKKRPHVRLSRSNGWTKAEREALFLAVTRFKLFGQWTKIKEMMNLHRSEEEIEREYRRLYVDDEDVEDSEDEPEEGQYSSQDGDDEEEEEEEEEDKGGREDEKEEGRIRRVGSSSPREPRIVDGVNVDQLPKKAQREFLRHRALMKRAVKQQKSMRVSEKEVLVDQRFYLEEIPMHL